MLTRFVKEFAQAHFVCKFERQGMVGECEAVIKLCHDFRKPPLKAADADCRIRWGALSLADSSSPRKAVKVPQLTPSRYLFSSCSSIPLHFFSFIGQDTCNTCMTYLFQGSEKNSAELWLGINQLVS